MKCLSAPRRPSQDVKAPLSVRVLLAILLFLATVNSWANGVLTTGGRGYTHATTASEDEVEHAHMELKGILRDIRGESAPAEASPLPELPTAVGEAQAQLRGFCARESIPVSPPAPLDMIRSMLRDAKTEIEQEARSFQERGQNLLYRRAKKAESKGSSDDDFVITMESEGSLMDNLPVVGRDVTDGMAEEEEELDEERKKQEMEEIELGAVDRNMRFCSKMRSIAKKIDQDEKKPVKKTSKVRRLLNRLGGQLSKVKSGAKYLKAKVASAIAKWDGLPGIRGKIIRGIKRVAKATWRLVKRAARRAAELFLKYLPFISIAFQATLIAVAVASNPVGLAIVSLVFSVAVLIYEIIKRGTDAMYNLQAQKHFKAASTAGSARGIMGLTWARVATEDSEGGEGLAAAFNKGVTKYADTNDGVKIRELWRSRRYKLAMEFGVKKTLKWVYRGFIVLLGKLGSLASFFMVGLKCLRAPHVEIL